MTVSEAGRKGARTLNARLSKQERTESARRAAKARWKDHKLRRELTIGVNASQSTPDTLKKQVV